jgi:predicted MPP superfamily phosphohydrolase
MFSPPSHKTLKLMWMTDLHLDKTSSSKTRRLLTQIAGMKYDCTVVTGDISSAPYLADHLRELAAACYPRRLYFVLGNHDFHSGTIAAVKKEVNIICHSAKNLHHLQGHELVPLSRDTVLIGDGGWADMRAGWGKRTIIGSRDHHSIGDFRNLSKEDLFSRMASLGYESATRFRTILPVALGRYRHVVVATHVPPFHQTAHYNGYQCGATHQPHFVNVSAGLALYGIARQFPGSQVTVLAGHTHSPVHTWILRNLEVRVGGARTGNPAVHEVLSFP